MAVNLNLGFDVGPISNGCPGCQANTPVFGGEPMEPDPDSDQQSGEYKVTIPPMQRPGFAFQRVPAEPEESDLFTGLFCFLRDVKVKTEDGECVEGTTGCEERRSCKHTLTLVFECTYTVWSYSGSEVGEVELPVMGIVRFPGNLPATSTTSDEVDEDTGRHEWTVETEIEPGCDSTYVFTMAYGSNFEPKATGGTGLGGNNWRLDRQASFNLDQEIELQLPCEPCAGQSS